MRASRSPSDWFRTLSRRERIFLSAGGAISAAALGVSLILVPLAEGWSGRETAYAASREQWTRLQGLVAGEAQLRRTLDEQKRAQRGTLELLLTGATPALAASNLQALLQQYAEESLAQLNRVDVAGQPKVDRPGLLSVPIMLQGQGDIYALVDFLSRLQHGPRLLVVDEISITSRSAWQSASLKGAQPLSWSIRAHGFYPGQGGGT